ncbi:MAG: hypothetical protein U1E78_09155 [Gammaproteobacteria bacterium]
MSNRSVHKVHEDCEMGDGNNPENSAVKGIYPRVIEYQTGSTLSWD